MPWRVQRIPRRSKSKSSSSRRTRTEKTFPTVELLFSRVKIISKRRFSKISLTIFLLAGKKSSTKGKEFDPTKIKLWNSDDIKIPFFDESKNVEIAKFAIFQVKQISRCVRSTERIKFRLNSHSQEIQTLNNWKISFDAFLIDCSAPMNSLSE